MKQVLAQGGCEMGLKHFFAISGVLIELLMNYGIHVRTSFF